VPLDTRKLVVRPQGLRGPLPWAAAALGVLVLLWVAFEVGRARAGYSVTTAFAERRQLRAEVERLQARATELEAQLASAEIARRVDRESYAQVEKSLADLQSRLGEQSQELAFYRGIVSPGDGTVGLRVQRLLVQPAAEPQHFRLRVVLIQAARQDAIVTGTVDVKIDGQRAGRPLSLSLSELGLERPLSYSFRYFQEVEAEIEVPAGVTPARVQIEVRPRGADAPVRASYPWTVDTA
jgi:RES domain-containing protein